MDPRDTTELLSTLNDPNVIMDDDAVIHLTQQTRKQMLGQLLHGGMPEDTDQQQHVMALLNDMDRTATANKRIQSQDDVGDKVAQAGTLIAAVYKQLGNQDPFQGNGAQIPQAQFPDVSTVPGEMEIGVSQISYDEINHQDHPTEKD